MEKTDKFNYIKTENFCTLKDINRKCDRSQTEQSAKLKNDKELVSSLYKEHRKTNIKKYVYIAQVKNRQMTQRYCHRKRHEWPISILKE